MEPSRTNTRSRSLKVYDRSYLQVEQKQRKQFDERTQLEKCQESAVHFTVQQEVEVSSLLAQIK